MLLPLMWGSVCDSCCKRISVSPLEDRRKLSFPCLQLLLGVLWACKARQNWVFFVLQLAGLNPPLKFKPWRKGVFLFVVLPLLTCALCVLNLRCIRSLFWWCRTGLYLSGLGNSVPVYCPWCLNLLGKQESIAAGGLVTVTVSPDGHCGMAWKSPCPRVLTPGHVEESSGGAEVGPLAEYVCCSRRCPSKLCMEGCANTAWLRVWDALCCHYQSTQMERQVRAFTTNHTQADCFILAFMFWIYRVLVKRPGLCFLFCRIWLSVNLFYCPEFPFV